MSTRQGFLYIYLFTYWTIGLFSFLLFPDLVSASAICQPIYGGGESCAQTGKITINKTVQNPQTLQYVDNLGALDPKYNPGQIVQFQITIKNTSNISIKNIEIKDRLPQYMDGTKIITFNINNLNAQETQIFTLKGKVTSKNNLPEDKEIICLINQATATQNQQTSQDNSQFCIQKNLESSTTTQPANPSSTKGGLPVYPPSTTNITPQTGPETIALFGLFASGLAGFMLRKKK
jgi:uncharacterized repeat protein (TIGR01451 family)